MKTSRKCCFPSGRGSCLRLLAVVFSVAFASVALTAGAESPGTIKLVEYIESSGTQYINTGFSPLSKNVKLEMTYRFVSLPAVGSRKYVFGSCQGTNNMRFQYAVGSAGNCAFGFGEGWVNNATVDSYDTDKIHTIVCSNGVFTLDGNVVQDLSSRKFERPDVANAPVCLFTNNNKGSIDQKYTTSMRLYSCRIWNNDELVRDFVPALDDNSTACLYDIVGESFYSNAGSGDFTAGDVTREVSLSYRKADYIETDRTAFIDTGYVPNGNTKLEMEFAFTKEVSTKKYVFGTYASGGRYMFSYGPASTGCFLGYGTNYQNNVSGLTYNTERHVIKYVPEFGFYFDGELVTNATVNLTEWIIEKGNAKNIFLCTCNRNGDAINTDHNAPIRIYSCKIWENDELKCNLVPKQRVFDGKNGLYDTVRNKFYGYYGSSTDFTAHFSSGMLIIVR